MHTIHYQYRPRFCNSCVVRDDEESEGDDGDSPSGGEDSFEDSDGQEEGPIEYAEL